MTTSLFWDLRGNATTTWAARAGALRAHIVRMALSFGVDVFMFVESGFDPADLITALNRQNVGRYTYPHSTNERIQIITRFDPLALTEQYDSDNSRLTIRTLTTKTTTVLLAVIHFQSQSHSTPVEQATIAPVMRDTLHFARMTC